MRTRVRESDVRTLILQFTDILGSLKAVMTPLRGVERALAGDVMFDGSALEGFVRVEEADMRLLPDVDTFVVDSWQDGVARLICDIANPDGTPFDGCPRTQLKRQLARLSARGLDLEVLSEPEFFLYEQGTAVETEDLAGYFDFSPEDRGEAVRRAAVDALESMGVPVAAHHHEVSPGQHEIDLDACDALCAADRLAWLRIAIHSIAPTFGTYATFMPKPRFGINGSGLHLHLRLLQAGEDVLADGADRHGLSSVGKRALAGLLQHAPAMTAVANPLVNSYKRLTPGYEAPVTVNWSLHQRSPLVRVVPGKPLSLEWRSPDPAANPYLVLAVAAAAMLDGIDRQLTLPPPLESSTGERLPADLSQAVQELARDEVIAGALGVTIARNLREAKEIEWEIYQSQVHAWELEQYLRTF